MKFLELLKEEQARKRTRKLERERVDNVVERAMYPRKREVVIHPQGLPSKLIKEKTIKHGTTEYYIKWSDDRITIRRRTRGSLSVGSLKILGRWEAWVEMDPSNIRGVNLIAHLRDWCNGLKKKNPLEKFEMLVDGM